MVSCRREGEKKRGRVKRKDGREAMQRKRRQLAKIEQSDRSRERRPVCHACGFECGGERAASPTSVRKKEEEKGNKENKEGRGGTKKQVGLTDAMLMGGQQRRRCGRMQKRVDADGFDESMRRARVALSRANL